MTVPPRLTESADTSVAVDGAAGAIDAPAATSAPLRNTRQRPRTVGQRRRDIPAPCSDSFGRREATHECRVDRPNPTLRESIRPGGSSFTTARSCPEVVHSVAVIHRLLPAPLLPDYDEGLFTGLHHQGAPPFPPHPSPWRGAAHNPQPRWPGDAPARPDPQATRSCGSAQSVVTRGFHTVAVVRILAPPAR
jgi:hypothetical protein